LDTIYVGRSELYRNTDSRKRSDIFIGLLVLLAFAFCPPVMAEEQNGWQLDSLSASPNVSKPDAQQVYEVLLKMLDRWNAHDIEGL
jgi:hypothetical protein